MENLIEKIKVSSIISKEEIDRIRLYINKKYPNNSAKENSHILAKSINGIIDKNLEGINEKYIDSIRKTIIQNTILKNKHIFKVDVFNACISRAEENVELKNSIIEWLNKNESTKICKDDFDKYIATLSTIEKTSYKHNNILDNEAIIEIDDAKNSIAYSEVAMDIEISTDTGCDVLLNKDVNFKMHINKKVAFSLVFLCMLAIFSISYLILVRDKITTTTVKNYINVKNNINTKNNITVKKLVADNKVKNEDVVNKSEYMHHPHLPDKFNFKEINEVELKTFLKTKNSLLMEEPYFSSIIKASREFNLNPLILFAITGQEQSFVPKHNKNAKKIANNPFNVFHSWSEYNTDIYDASRIASRTVINLSKNKPKEVDIFIWINRKYAEDKNWGKGVKAIYENLDTKVTQRIQQ